MRAVTLLPIDRILLARLLMDRAAEAQDGRRSEEDRATWPQSDGWGKGSDESISSHPIWSGNETFMSHPALFLNSKHNCHHDRQMATLLSQI